MTTYASMIARGYGDIAVYLDIAGFDVVFSTTTIKPSSGSWLSPKQGGVEPLLALDQGELGLEVSESINFVEGTSHVNPITLSIVDADGYFTKYLGTRGARNSTRLTSSITASSTTLNVEDTSDFSMTSTTLTADAELGDKVIHVASASGITEGMIIRIFNGTDSQNAYVADVDGTAIRLHNYIYYSFAIGDTVRPRRQLVVGQEHMVFTSMTATSFTGVSRGAYGSEARAHEVNSTLSPPMYPVVTDGLTIPSLQGRRANVYVGVVENGTVESATCVFRGFISPPIRFAKGVYRIELDNIMAYFGHSVGQRLPKVGVNEQYVLYNEDCRRIKASLYSTSGTIYTYTAYTNAQTKNGLDGLISHCNEVIAGMGIPRRCGLHGLGTDQNKCRLRGDANTRVVEFEVREGDVLWSLGFEPGFIEIKGDGSTYTETEANDPAKKVYITNAIPNYGILNTDRMTKNMPAETWFTIKGEDDGNVWQISSATAGAYQLYFWDDDPFKYSKYTAIEDVKDAVAMSCYRLGYGQTDVVDDIKRLFGLLSGQAEPESWGIEGITDDDIDWDELEDALSGVPSTLRHLDTVIYKSTKLSEILCDYLGALGISPRLTTDGKIGFSRCRWGSADFSTVVDVNDLYLDDEVHGHSAEVEFDIFEEPNINVVEIEHSYNFITDNSGAPITEIYEDGFDGTRNQKAKQYKLPVIVDSHRGDRPDTVEELADSIRPFLYACHFALYGRGAITVTLPVVHQAKQYRCGDLVLVSHEVLPDVISGETSTSAKFGYVVSRQATYVGGPSDAITVMIPDQPNYRLIAPSALATSYDQASKTLTFADTGLYSRSGETDLDHFSTGQTVHFYNFDSSAYGSWGEDTIATMTASMVTLTVDVFSTAFPANGVIMTIPDYNAADSADQSWCFICDTGYSLGTANDDGHNWAP